MEFLLQDLRCAARSLRKTPRFTAVAVLALAAGIGGSTSLFSVVDAVLLRPLRLPEPDRLVQVSQSGRDGSPSEWAPAGYQDLARETGALFEQIAAWYPRSGSLSGPAGAEQVALGAVTSGFFATLGVQPAIGRDFQPGEDLAGGDQVLIISDRFFRNALGRDPGALGRTVLLDDRPYTVIGVLPAGFRFPRLEDADGFVPIGFNATDLVNRGSQYLRAIARLRPGVKLAQARAQVALIGARIGERDPAPLAGRTATASRLQAVLIAPVRPLLGLLFAAVLLVLLIACANVAGLLLARGVARQREVAIRVALGGGRARIVWQLFAESLLIAVAGGALGLLVANWSTGALVAAAPAGTPRLDEVALDWRVAVFSASAAMVSAVLAGLWPAVQASRVSPGLALKESSRAVIGGRARATARSALVVGQIALALVLLAGAGLVVRSFRRLVSAPLGFDPERVLAARVSMPLTPLRWRSPAAYANFYGELVRRVGALPGVVSASAATLGPLDELGAWNNEFTVEGRAPEASGDRLWAMLNWATPGFFSTLGMRLVEGRFFDERDGAAAPRAAVVNQAFVRRFFPGASPVGQRIRLRFGINGLFGRLGETPADWLYQIVGVVADAREFGLGQAAEPQINLSALQQGFPRMNLLVKTQVADPLAVAPAVRGALASLDPSLPLARVRSYPTILAESTGRQRFPLLLLSLFGAVALALAALGIYGIVAFSVAQRTHEIGIRLALGARAGAVQRMMLAQGMWLAGAGIGVGVLGAFAATRTLRSLLYGVGTTDPLTFAAVATLLGCVAALASFLPARRATRIDPMAALKAD
jgi:putative ABC transport system permease protein